MTPLNRGAGGKKEAVIPASPLFHTRWVQEALHVLALEAVLVLLFWLAYRFGGFLGSFPFGDVLFIAGGIELMVAGFGMLRGDKDFTEVSGQAGRSLAAGNMGDGDADETQQRAPFGVRLAICGALTMLISTAIYLINKAGG